MSWVEGVPAVAGVLYLGASVGYAYHGQSGFSLTYFAYALANVGLIWAATAGRST